MMKYWRFSGLNVWVGDEMLTSWMELKSCTVPRYLTSVFHRVLKTNYTNKSTVSVLNN